ncbi:uncharacterized protein LOC122651436 isoform X4 [Telopea speciosissima]|uniref:uncharacterized protein LOC122651436 isoform X4 n=1 Tax=Telopea speciosissima TaxID=54955 RepID=UPI001CC36C4F|nr:uncharacterized protein LOC122651436 isoform X4 [Telopea speciosissima]
MSILGTRTTTPNPTITSNNNNTTNMGTPFFHEFKKQASFFLREKIKMARLALTDCTPAQLLTEDATNENQWAPDTRTMGLISRAAFEVDDYWRIVDILHKRFNWGLTVRKKSERVLKLLEKSQLLKEERDRARKLTRGIEGFGSFSHRSSSTEATSFRNSSMKMYERNHSESNDLEDNNQFSLDCSDEGQKNEMIKKQIDKSLKENKAPMEEITPELHEWDCKRESISLLDNQKDEVNVGFSIEEDHPFINSELQFTTSLTTT